MKTVRFGVIGCGLMGREVASAAARWIHLTDALARPEIVAVCDPSTAARDWFETALSHRLFTAALASQRDARTVALLPPTEEPGHA